MKRKGLQKQSRDWQRQAPWSKEYVELQLVGVEVVSGVWLIGATDERRQ